MTRELKQLADRTHNGSLSKLGKLLQDIMQSPQKVQMFLLPISLKKVPMTTKQQSPCEKHCPPKAVNTEEKTQKKIKSAVLAQQCGFQLV